MKLADHRGIETEVYGPAEDSALLAAAVEADFETAGLVLDVGTGSGYIGHRLAEATGAIVVGADINPHACRRARDNGVEAVLGDLTAPFKRNSFDAVVFNPPYLPAVDDVELDEWFERAVTGGDSGRAVINRYLSDVGRVLVQSGRAYLLISSLTGLDAVRSRAEAEGFDVRCIETVEYPDEELIVLRFQ